MDFILEGLLDSIKEKVGKCSSAKELWERLQNIYSNKYHPITRPNHIEQNKEEVKSKQEERCPSCQKNSIEEDCEADITYLDA
jgi:cytochrome c-type biogenesis protein CcmH/NrfF